MMQSGEKITLLIVDDIPETRENLRKLLYFEPNIEVVGMAGNGWEAVQKAKALQPHIVLMDINMPDMDGIAASQEITRAAPACQVIMMSVQGETDYLRRSMLAGAADFLVKPFTSEELSSSIRRVYEMGVSRRAAMPVMPVGPEGAPAGPAAAAGRGPSGGKLLLIYSPKGGTGCSTVATNLAIALGEVTSKKVVLVDASLQFGDLAVLLNLQGYRSITDIINQKGELDAEYLMAILAPHPSGIRVLPAPPAPETAGTIEPDDLKNILIALRKGFDYVIVDTWSQLDDIVLTAMDLADRILLVMAPEIPSIKSTKQFFEVSEALNFADERIDLILNKVLPRDSIRPEQLESNLKHKIAIQLDYDPRSIRQAINQGLPLIMAEPGHVLAEKFRLLAQQEVAILQPQPAQPTQEAAAEPAPEQKKRPGLLGRLKR